MASGGVTVNFGTKCEHVVITLLPSSRLLASGSMSLRSCEESKMPLIRDYSYNHSINRSSKVLLLLSAAVWKVPLSGVVKHDNISILERQMYPQGTCNQRV